MPLDSKCLTTSIVYKACVKSDDHPYPKFTLVLQKAPLRKIL